ncbi:MAG: hypothetical protein ACD_77C00042G0003 [uncultured bacterium]|nr:MAG: hypothetical protein ACD_77C00042G0003 [uncultured bacterium]
MVQNDFDKKVKELMDGFGEAPPADLWEGISSSLVRKRRAVLIRRGFGSLAAVAAVVALFFIMGGGEIFTSRPEMPAPMAGNLQKEVPKQKIAVVEQPVKRIAIAGDRRIEGRTDKITTDLATDSATDLKAEEIIVKPVEELVVRQTEDEPKVAVKEKAAVKEKDDNKIAVAVPKDNKKTLEMYEFEESVKSKGFKLSKPLLAVSTMLSPSLSSGSIELLSRFNSNRNDLISTMDREQLQYENVYDNRYLPPVSVGFQVILPVDKRVSFGTGVNYTLLYSYTDLQNRFGNERREQTVHYIGIPFNFYVNILETKYFRLYGSAGLNFEKGVVAKYRVTGDFPENYSERVPGVQWSVAAGVGGEYLLHKNLGLYADPSLSYFFPGRQPVTIRTVEPLQFKFEVGLRFHF